MPDLNNQKQDHWEDIFETIDMEFLPLEYINMVVVDFDNGDTWEIDIKHQPDTADIDDVLQDFFEEYQDTIVNVDFRLDIDRIKKDISKRTRRFLKLNK